MMKKVIIIGSGAGGATAAKELAGTYDVTVLEAGVEFRPLTINLQFLEKLRKTGLFFDERLIRLLFPAMQIRLAADKMVLVNGIATGGTTTLCTGSAMRMDKHLREIGINLNDEFDELYKEIPVSTDHQKKWRATTGKLFEICDKMGLDPQPTPKMGWYHRCIQCGHCAIGCPRNVKWDSRRFLESALQQGARLFTRTRVEKIITDQGVATGVHARSNSRIRFIPADLIIVAAGGLGTPVILQNSGIVCESKLFVDPVLCVAAEWPDAGMDREIPMPFVVQQDNFIISPYFDYLSFFFNKHWRAPAKNILSVMIKLADDNSGDANGRKIHKKLSDRDHQNLKKGMDICSGILHEFGIKHKDIFLGTVNAGHPGGTLPLTRFSAASFHPEALPANVYIADATLFPRSMGNPPILTIMAMSKRVSRLSKKILD